MTIHIIKSPSTQHFPVIKSPPKTKSSIYLYFIPPPQPSTQHDIFQSNHSNPCKLHQNDPQHTKMIPQVDSSAHQTPSIYISLSAPHINTQHVLVFNHNTKGFWRMWILAHNQYYLSTYRKGVLAHIHYP